ncbi:GNAT family N-acetyltransferase [Lichenifustis flavocetrariae]|uniref:GNAT family N-acetyltransferase n=1 Tax=Lichenifustis flavocetrariae TaxID=2949735 RepID=A0AA41YTV8_9HYPH|nr:GNAT family N-acetyltransferase [Lichenifustis flavocetrariae]MCW6506748.1 GNAT family N-acetyltransferase [Lichenifustis flavocetrariae]
MTSALNTTPGRVAIRPARPADIELVLQFVRELAIYEKLEQDVVATAGDFAAALFGPQPRVFCDIAECDGDPAGFALWFYSFSTFRGRHGLYLEDLFVRPDFRRHGIGKALLRTLAHRCVVEGLPRLEWAVLDWNTPAIAFYRSQGASLQDDWTTCRLTGDALADLGRAG